MHISAHPPSLPPSRTEHSEEGTRHEPRRGKNPELEPEAPWALEINGFAIAKHRLELAPILLRRVYGWVVHALGLVAAAIPSQPSQF